MQLLVKVGRLSQRRSFLPSNILVSLCNVDIPAKLEWVKPGRFTRSQVDLRARQEYDNQDAR